MPDNRKVTHEVKIAVTKDGNMSYSPAVLYASRGDRIRWLYESGSLTISFRKRSPVQCAVSSNPSLAPVEGCPNGPQFRSRSAKEPIDAEVSGPSGVYRYAVAATLDNFIFVDAACPEVIIR